MDIIIEMLSIAQQNTQMKIVNVMVLLPMVKTVLIQSKKWLNLVLQILIHLEMNQALLLCNQMESFNATTESLVILL